VVSSDALAQLQSSGWVAVETPYRGAGTEDLATGLERIATALGRPVAQRRRQTVATLRPQTASVAPRASLSAKYGLDAMPFHVDGSHLTRPYRYLLLSSPAVSPVATLLLDTLLLKIEAPLRDELLDERFFVQNGRHSFYSTILSHRRPFWRLDPGCMHPMTNRGAALLEVTSANSIGGQLSTFQWNQPGRILILDNWRMLHARGGILDTQLSRLLLRVAVE
jgi:hypothetical protein